LHGLLLLKSVDSGIPFRGYEDENSRTEHSIKVPDILINQHQGNNEEGGG